MFNFVASSMRHSRVEFATLKPQRMAKELTLQFKGSLYPILRGKQKEETRLIYPRNWQLYVKEDYYGEPIHYNTLKLINGRQPNAPWLRVKVKSEQVVVLTDEKGNDLTYVQDGVEYLKLMVVYDLGKIVETNMQK